MSQWLNIDLYAAELFDVIAACRFAAHSYADDTQVYISVPASDHYDAMRRLSDCITQIRDWMASNRLRVNEEKTGYLVGNTSAAKQSYGTCSDLAKRHSTVVNSCE